LEDKIVQAAVVICILTPIYEEEFLDFSHGFRPKRKAHDALDAVAYVVERRKVSYVVDADIQAFFDQVDQGWLVRFLEHRIADKRVIRLIIKWLKAGVMQEGQWQATPRGTPQGAVISPILANIYLHYVLDLWFAKRWQPKRAGGEAYIIRYADDFVVGFQYRADAERFLRDLRQRLDKFGLCLHPDKTRLIEFGCFAAGNRRRRGEGRPDTFDFLGFTHYCRTTRGGRFGLGRKPIAKRMSRKLTGLYQMLKRRMHEDVRATARWLGSVLSGWLNYYAVPTSFRYLKRFRRRLHRLWYKVLRRRSQKDRTSREQLDKLAAAHWPKLRIRHPWPDRRFSVTHYGATRGRSRVH
jgi:group II intron reverse transcriptase/maturase